MDEALPFVLEEWPGPVVEEDAAVVAEDLVRSYYRAWEHRQRLLPFDSSQLGLAVLMNLAKTESGAGVWA